MAEADDRLEYGRQVIATEMEGLRALRESLGESFLKAVDTILACKGHVIVTGMGKSGHVGRKIAATMASTGTPAHFVHPAEASHGDLGMIGHRDVLLAISHSGETRELSDILLYGKRKHLPVIAITGKADSTLGRVADVTLLLPDSEEACPLRRAPTTSTLATLALGDALAMTVMKERGFGEEDFAGFHPGGKLGAALMTMADIISAKEDRKLPLVPPDADMRTIMLTNIEGMLGHVGVASAEGRLIGIISDGDLRRAFAAGKGQEKAEAIMTTSPKVVPPDMRAAEALELMKRHRISALFVVDEKGCPLGLVHLQELLRL